ncbi:hypothetical protein CEUSTIGMA_g8413.t1 [Chlamydomonas eustigma]|uniref:PDEase domain-containing protein n=1 Tax=Chlamydomonas eustigma TaxID=1157962 RepID=A0A250XD06_9CHLO|nr:hypothetical protein CEUSTIGMA_g8413.t1 [Chlamydomonas eustigma]|eukprot:GAX80978.1 hypothetical protein CEUSTIGMA_g8413.t1 [Chlamydomonas eustigma]
MALKCADLGHLTSEVSVHQKWVELLQEEMFLQGDKERALGMVPISPLMDRNKPGITHSQTGFFSVVAQPLYAAFTSVFPDAQPLMDGLNANNKFWQSKQLAENSSQH